MYITTTGGYARVSHIRSGPTKLPSNLPKACLTLSTHHTNPSPKARKPNLGHTQAKTNGPFHLLISTCRPMVGGPQPADGDVGMAGCGQDFLERQRAEICELEQQVQLLRAHVANVASEGQNAVARSLREQRVAALLDEFIPLPAVITASAPAAPVAPSRPRSTSERWQKAAPATPRTANGSASLIPQREKRLAPSAAILSAQMHDTAYNPHRTLARAMRKASSTT